MSKKFIAWRVPVCGALFLATGVPAEEGLQRDQDNPGHVTIRLRLGLNIKGKFKGLGSGFSMGSAAGNSRTTPHGDPYNYDNGYVLPDYAHVVGGSHDQYSWYWGYDQASQVNAAGNTISFNRTTSSSPGDTGSQNESPYIGVEVVYDYELGEKVDWHHLRYGIEGAVNYMPIDFESGGSYSVSGSRTTDTYAYAPGTTPPGFNNPGELPYQGSFQGPGFVINGTPTRSSTVSLGSGTILAQQHFDANLWGFRVGPYIEYPFTKKFNLHLTGGLAMGLLDGEASWKETLTLGAFSTTQSGGGHDLNVLFGYYIGLDANYQLNDRWGMDAGVQFQDLGTYDHNFGGRTVELDLSRSIFVHAGISYSF
jgi:hypothetical protein